jgi:hypothetical protein
MPKHVPIGEPHDLAARLWSELGELLDHGEISQSLAQRIVNDLFEARRPGDPVSLTCSALRTYMHEQKAIAGIRDHRRKLSDRRR